MRSTAALLWRRILTADPEAVFGTQASRSMNRNWADRLSQPGYMGLHCRARWSGVRVHESGGRAAGWSKRGMTSASTGPRNACEMSLNTQTGCQESQERCAHDASRARRASGRYFPAIALRISMIVSFSLGSFQTINKMMSRD